MKIKWKELAVDTAVTLTMPLWIIPGALLLVTAILLSALMDNYTAEDKPTGKEFDE